ncbi:MAG: glycoside hydrolase family 48 protein, partial [Ruminococcus sp.]
WLISNDGPIAGGCTNSWNGRYEQYPSGQATFNDMAYLEHPVYADPGSNHWIGNQVWAVQRLAEMYYLVKTGEGPKSDVNIGGMDLEQCLELLLDKWVGWFLDNSILGKANATKTFSDYYEPYDTEKSEFTVPDLSKGVTDDGVSFQIPASLIWDGQPNTWTGSYQENTGLTCTIVGYGDGDLGCVSSLANTLLYYSRAKGITGADLSKGEASYKANQGTKGSVADYPAQALYLAKELIDREWNKARDDIGLSIEDHNTNLPRLWETKLVLPNGSRQNGQGKTLDAARYTGKMPNGDEIKDGVAFYDIRTKYKDCDMYQKAKAEYDAKGHTDDYYFKLHRFWHAGDVLMALGGMFELYPELTPDGASETDDLTVDKSEIALEVGETDKITPSGGSGDYTYESADKSVADVAADGTVTGIGEGTTTITVKDSEGNSVEVKVTVTDKATTTETTTTTGTEEFNDLIGDTNLDGAVGVVDVVYLNKYLAKAINFNAQQLRNAQCVADDLINSSDSTTLLKYTVKKIDSLPVAP